MIRKLPDKYPSIDSELSELSEKRIKARMT